MSSDPDQIRDEINQTQRDLSADVDALTEKLSPPKIVERRVQATRDAMTNVKDKIMGSTGQGTSNVRETASSQAASAGQAVTDRASAVRDSAAATVSSATDAARSAPGLVRRQAIGNPLAAGLIAFGAGWLLSSLLPASAPEQQAATQVKDFATEHGRPVAQQLGQAGQQAAEQLRESAQQRAESVKNTAADAASTVSGEAQTAASHVTSQAQESASTVREQVGPGN
jgi:cell division septum initiation protein DivIVA